MACVGTNQQNLHRVRYNVLIYKKHVMMLVSPFSWRSNLKNDIQYSMIVFTIIVKLDGQCCSVKMCGSWC